MITVLIECSVILLTGIFIMLAIYFDEFKRK